MKIYPINNTTIFRGTERKPNLKRYCEPRTGAYYYYDEDEVKRLKAENSLINKIKRFFKENKTSVDTMWLY